MTQQRLSVAVEAVGGLGNQLFFVSAALVAAWENNRDAVVFFNSADNYHFRTNFLSSVFTRVPRVDILPPCLTRVPDPHTAALPQLPPGEDALLCGGYFQRAPHLLPHRDRLIATFAPDTAMQMRVDAHIERLRALFPCGTRVVGVQVRRGDFHPNGWALPAATFRAAMDAFALLFFNGVPATFVVFSDDLGAVRAEFPELPLADGFEDDAHALFTLSKLDGVIVSPKSTFGWWAGFFASHSNVLVPGAWALEPDELILCPGWKRLLTSSP